jgi:hypothetical protein
MDCEGTRVLVEGGNALWDRFLPAVVTGLNDRVLKVHGYSPSQLLLGTTPRRSSWDVTPREDHIADGLERLYKHDPYFNTLTVDGGHVAIRMAALDEARNRCLDRLDMHHRNIVRKEQLKAHWTAPKVGDLVLLRRMARDGQRSHKLAAR